MNSKERQVMQQALEALESRCGTNAEERGPAGAITALRAALADGDNLSPTEPVAWMWEETAPRSSTGIGGIDRKLLFCRPADEPWKRNITPLYTAPPQRKPLTDKQKLDLATNWFAEDWAIEKALDLLDDYDYEIEQAHGIKDQP